MTIIRNKKHENQQGTIKISQISTRVQFHLVLNVKYKYNLDRKNRKEIRALVQEHKIDCNSLCC